MAVTQESVCWFNFSLDLNRQTALETERSGAMMKAVAISLVMGTALGTPCVSDSWAQAKTEVPPKVDGAKPTRLERIKIHGITLEGNLEARSNQVL
jgi:hypothetical protein